MIDPIETERQAIALFGQALDIPSPDRLAWIETQTEGQTALRERLLAMLRADSLISLKTGAATDALEPEADPARIGAYRITGLIGRGGMGAVYRGERMTGDFHHTVAIKIIKTGLMSAPLIERFERERQTLARLSHPNIAQLYDGGETDTGAPYIVMECVDGLPLFDWVTERGPDEDTRLRLFGDVCRAVAFAHRNLIVHRDLTPSNILVTDEGVVKLIDFGIAKPPEDPAEAHMSGSASIAGLSLTPGYAAPERLTHTEVTTAADVYSLGRLLTKLIEPASPELSAIAARASATEIADRYPGVDALLADIERYRTGYPVEAVGREGTYVFRKFFRRHRLPVLAGVSAGVAIVVAFGGVLVANARTEAALAEAEQRFNETRAIANTLLFDVYDEVSKVSGATQAREMLAKTGVDYLDKLANDARAPVAVRIEAGQGFVRLAQVVGGGQESSLGRYADANALLARGEGILKAVHEQNPDNADAAKAYADLLLEQSGTNLYNNNDPKAAREQALKVQALLKDRATSDAKLANAYILAIQAEGDAYGWDNDYETMRTVMLRADSFYKGLPATLRDDPIVLGARSSSLRLLGEAQHKLKRADEAKATLAEAVSVNRARVKLERDNPKTQRGLIIALWYSAVVHRTNMRDPEAQAAISEAYGLARDWAKRDPDDNGVLQLVAITGEVYAQVLTDQKQYDAAERISDEVMAAHRTMVARAGDAPGAIRSQTTAMATRGGNFYNAGRYDKACEAWVQTRDNFALLARRGQLTATDRDNGYAEVKDFLARACQPPRAGLGKEI
ncbi:serine/threonine-protein kinase [Asticcacaulis sp. YBE204]|uniref:serine/threonine-protein kinase n=1 Tax=Asticcacaulis sp. YBE204 TaxID=1282363 RepID=UPI0003C40215|nr:serine/threonine-protein kinase [Asticcacaulis sp. YBE204]ESQ76892.1 hypothetical protein AEYBE204_18625 [Asticcacaulis sp. YBE204]